MPMARVQPLMEALSAAAKFPSGEAVSPGRVVIAGNSNAKPYRGLTPCAEPQQKSNIYHGGAETRRATVKVEKPTQETDRHGTARAEIIETFPKQVCQTEAVRRARCIAAAVSYT